MGHVIQKQLFSLSASDIKQAREWEGKLHSIIHRVINPCIDKYFDEVSSPAEHIIIEKIEIDLGMLNKKNSQQLEESIRTQLRSQFEKHTKASIPSKSFTQDGSDDGVSNKTHAPQLSRHKKNYTCFLHFIRYGILPWWAEADTVNFEDGWINDLSAGEADRIASIFSEQPQLLDRLVYQFSENFIADLIRQYLPQETGAILQSWQSIATHYSLTIDNGKLHRYYWKFWMEKSMRLSTDASFRNLREAMASWLKSMHHAVNQLLEEFREASRKYEAGTAANENRNIVSGELFPSTVVQTLIHEVIERDTELRSLLPPLTGTQYQKKDDALRDQFEHAAENAGHTLKEDQPGPTTQNTISDEIDTTNPWRQSPVKPGLIKNKSHPTDADRELPLDEEGQFISGAGVVLLHPFLTELFSSAGLWSQDGWTSEFSQHQAAQMIAFMAFGRTDLPEYEMLLPKVMTNTSISEPLDMRIDLPEKCRQLAEELLTAVIGHWTAIGNTSIDGLREGFIQREGKLLRKNDNWQLTVENKAQDILLNRLPWGISFIHLPWLAPSTMQVKWTD